MLHPDALGDLGLHHLVHHDEPGRRREREQSVFDGFGHIGKRQRRLERELGQLGCLLRLGDAESRSKYSRVTTCR